MEGFGFDCFFFICVFLFSRPAWRLGRIHVHLRSCRSYLGRMSNQCIYISFIICIPTTSLRTTNSVYTNRIEYSKIWIQQVRGLTYLTMVHQRMSHE